MEFEKPVGASADAKELEYIAALHQTDATLRTDGSIDAIDVVNFLSSRYGIRVTVDEVRQTVLRGLGGGDGEDECIDLTEVVTILLIPELIKASKLLLEGDTPERQRDEFESNWEYKDYKRRFEISQSRLPDPQVIGKVLDMILKDTTGSDRPQRLNRQLMKDMFDSYGESALVQDDNLIDEMIAVASSGTSVNGEVHDEPVLDRKTFARALTSDLEHFDVENETRLTTHYYDVFGTHNSTKESKRWSIPFLSQTSHTSHTEQSYAWWETDKSSKTETQDEEEQNIKTRPVERIFTFPAIDYIACTYKSKTFVILLWVTAVVTYFAYMWDFEVAFGRIDCSDIDKRSTLFGCRVVNGIINWVVIMLELSILGSSFVIFGSAGNSIFSNSRIAILVGMGSVTVFTILPFIYDWKTVFFETENRSDSQYVMIYYVSLVLACILLIMQAKNLLMLCLPRKVLAANKRLARFFAPPIAVTESNTKQAAAYKMKALLKNAMSIHVDETNSVQRSRTLGTCYGEALLKYERDAEGVSEVIGGIRWTWGRIFSGALYREDGVFLNSQIVAGNAAQIVVCLFIAVLTVALFIVEVEADDADDDSFIQDFVPERWMVLVSTTLGLSCGFLASVSIALVYMPSSVSTIMQFRTGVIPSLRDKHFLIYRRAVDQIAILFGSIFWGSFYTAFSCAIFIGGIVFLAVWQVTNSVFWAILANLVGLCVTLGFKFLVLMLLRKTFFAAFYRTRPAQANFMGVVLESWNVALATGYLLGRTLMLVLATVLNIGRIDRPFLSRGAAFVGPMPLDSYPIAFRKALLCVEAHRHPYLERLGSMYMMKLRYGDGFAKTSGSCWRLLFVFALMPWLRKYRISTRPVLQDEYDTDAIDFKWGTFRNLPKPNRRYSLDVTSFTNGTDADRETDQPEDEIRSLRSENDSLREEIKLLRKQHEQLLMSTGLYEND